MKLPLFPSAAWLALNTVILSRRANVARLGVCVHQPPKMLYKSYILLIPSNSIHFLREGAWMQVELFSRHPDMQTMPSCPHQPFAEGPVQASAWSCLRKTKVNRRLQTVSVYPWKWFLFKPPKQKLTYFIMLTDHWASAVCVQHLPISHHGRDQLSPWKRFKCFTWHYLEGFGRSTHRRLWHRNTREFRKLGEFSCVINWRGLNHSFLQHVSLV